MNKFKQFLSAESVEDNDVEVEVEVKTEGEVVIEVETSGDDVEVTVTPADDEAEVEVEVEVEVDGDAGEDEVVASVEDGSVEDGEAVAVDETIEDDTEDVIEEVLEEEVAEIQERLDDEIAEAEEAEQVGDELEEIQAAVEGYIEILEHGIEAKDFSPQFAYALSLALESYQDLVDDTLVLPSLENYSKDDLEPYYVASLESLQGFLSRIGNAIANSFAKPLENMANSIRRNTNNRISKALADGAASAIAALAEKSGDKVAIAIGGARRQFAIAGQFPSDVTQGVATDLRSLQLLGSKYLEEAVAYNKKLLDLVAKLDTATENEVIKVLDTIYQIKPPATVIPQDLLSGKGLIGNRQVRFEEKERGATIYESVRGLKKTKPPRIKRMRVKSPKVETLELSRSQIKALLESVKAYARLIDNINSFADKELSGLLRSVRRNTGPGAYAKWSDKSWAVQKQQDELIQILRRAPRYITGLGTDTMQLTYQNAVTTLTLARRAIRALK